MAESLNVIALISGGKDSFYSLYHCLQNGHNVVALGNLYPAPPTHVANHEAESVDEHDLNSFMYQTVGHTVIPLYEKALGIPLFRQEIAGSAVQTGTSYDFEDDGQGNEGSEREEDETESLVPLLKKIMKAHPEANALSTGAILSTYQRTRIESVALRLSLTPLAYLWEYPILPPGTQISLLEDMQHVGLDARIVKVASGGLDETFMWQNVADSVVYRRIEKSMKRFGTDGDGAVLGEGGEFETLVVDGPDDLFKGSIVVKEEARRIVREGGGSAWMKILNATVVMKEPKEILRQFCRVPDLLEARFKKAFGVLNYNSTHLTSVEPGTATPESKSSLALFKPNGSQDVLDTVLYWTVTASNIPCHSIGAEAGDVINQMRQLLHKASLTTKDIISTVIVLRSMADFKTVNTVYGSLFPHPNPPTRVTISCGPSMAVNTNIIIHLRVQNPASFPSSSRRKALHVQSRSYWAPANIGPYSQAISIPLAPPFSSPNNEEKSIRTVTIAGQIPLVPDTMVLPSLALARSFDQSLADNPDKEFNLQTILSLQHLFRVGLQMGVGWFTSTVAYLPAQPCHHLLSTKATIAGNAWSYLHSQDLGENDEEEEEEGNERDLWEEKYLAGMGNYSGSSKERRLPDWEMLAEVGKGNENIPPFFAAEVEELPRGAGIEWHAHMGIVGGSGIVELRNHKSKNNWIIHQTVFGNTMKTVVTLKHTGSATEVSTRIEEALATLGQEKRVQSSASYIDTSIPGISRLEIFAGLVPCRSLWDGQGRRLAAVLVFETYYSVSDTR